MHTFFCRRASTGAGSRALIWPLALSLCAAFAFHGSTVRAEEYHLGVMDKLRVRVAEWQTAEGAVRDWSAVSGDYTVGASGKISLPFLGELPASGKTTEEVSVEIGEKMQQLFGLRDRPSASVEIAQYRPIYISGEIQSPGQYAYVPGMTVLKALSLGGGLRRPDPGQRVARDYIRSEGDASVLIAERNRLLARRARLQAEIAGKDSISLPKELEGVSEADQLLASETALMKSRNKRLTLQLQALADLKTLLNSEIESLAKKADTQSRQLELVQSDREKVYNLTEKGLAVSSRRLSIEQQMTDLQAGLLDIDTASLKARQDINKAGQDETNLRNDWDAQLAQELQNTERELETNTLKLGTSRDLMSEALMQSAVEATSAKETTTVTYAIVREVDGKAREMPVNENTPVLPGDVVKVSVGVAMR